MNDAKRVLEQAIDLWNTGDREGWAALYDADVEWEAPGWSAHLGTRRPQGEVLRRAARSGPRPFQHRRCAHCRRRRRRRGRAVYRHSHRDVAQSQRGRNPPDGQEPRFRLQRDLPRTRRQDHIDPPVLRPDGSTRATWAGASACCGLEPEQRQVLPVGRPDHPTGSWSAKAEPCPTPHPGRGT